MMIISWNMTKRCNLYCKHCYREAGPNENISNELSTKEGRDLIRSIADSGFRILVFSGGEPLLREDIFELTSYAASLGLIPALGTNGTLITCDTAMKLKKSGVNSVAISLDSLNPEKHDVFRQYAGSFDKAIKGIKESINAGLKVQVNTTVTKDNYDEIMDIIDYVKNLGVNSHHPFFLVEVGRGRNIGNEGLNKKEYKDIIDRIILKQRDTNIELKPTCAPQFMVEAKEMGIPMRFSRGCIAGISYCCVLPNGDVNICPYLPIKAGNVRELPFEVIWKESEVFKNLRNYSNYKGKCGKCPNINICGGCRARAFSKTGDYMQEDTFCLLGE